MLKVGFEGSDPWWVSDQGSDPSNPTFNIAYFFFGL